VPFFFFRIGWLRQRFYVAKGLRRAQAIQTLRAHVARWRGFGHLAMISNNVFSINCVDTWPAI
jgi:hypothetical protein